MRQKKNTHTQDNIYVVWQFAYIHKVAGISLLSWKNTRCSSIVFSLKTTPPPKKNPNLQTTIFLSCVQDSRWAKKWAKKGCRPKPLLHRLSLKKNPIKYHNTLISGRVIIQIKHNQVPQCPTKDASNVISPIGTGLQLSSYYL